MKIDLSKRHKNEFRYSSKLLEKIGIMHKKEEDEKKLLILDIPKTRKKNIGFVSDKVSKKGMQYMEGFLQIEDIKVHILLFRNNNPFKQGDWTIVKAKKIKEKKTARQIETSLNNKFLTYSRDEEELPF